MTRSSLNESSPPLIDNVGPRTETPFGGVADFLSGEAWIWNELAVGASLCFLNMVELLAMRSVSPRRSMYAARTFHGSETTVPSAAMIALSRARIATHLT